MDALLTSLIGVSRPVTTCTTAQLRRLFTPAGHIAFVSQEAFMAHAHANPVGSSFDAIKAHLRAHDDDQGRRDEEYGLRALLKANQILLSSEVQAYLQQTPGVAVGGALPPRARRRIDGTQAAFTDSW
jgi:hypothetical protein